MSADLFWLSDEQFARIAPLLPTDTRGKKRVDDRRVISGIIHVLKSGGRWIDAPADYGPRKTLYNRFVRWADKGVWVRLFETLARAGGPALQLMIDSSAVKAHRRRRAEKGEKNQAIGRSRGGRTTKIHAVTDEHCRPVAFILTGGQVPDCVAAQELIEKLPECAVVNGDKGYDADELRRKSKRAARSPTSLPSPTESRSRASPPSSIATETPSSACSAASRTSAASLPVTTGMPHQFPGGHLPCRRRQLLVIESGP